MGASVLSQNVVSDCVGSKRCWEQRDLFLFAPKLQIIQNVGEA